MRDHLEGKSIFVMTFCQHHSISQLLTFLHLGTKKIKIPIENACFKFGERFNLFIYHNVTSPMNAIDQASAVWRLGTVESSI